MAQSVMQRIQQLSHEREELVARESRHENLGAEGRERLSRLDHDIQVLWDLRRREMSGEEISLDEDYLDNYTVDPSKDAPDSAGGEPGE